MTFSLPWRDARYSCRIAALFLLLFVAPVMAAQAPEPAKSPAATQEKTQEGEVSYAYYLISCGNYIQHRASPSPSDNNNTADMFYAAGWLSAYNRLSSTGGVGEEVTLENVMLWLEEYCHDDPLGNLHDGLLQLARELKEKRKNGDAKKPAAEDAPDIPEPTPKGAADAQQTPPPTPPAQTEPEAVMPMQRPTAPPRY